MEALHSYPEQLYTDALALLKHMISIPSFSREEQGTAEALAHFLRSRGIHPERKGNNLWVKNRYFDPSLPTLLLNSHHDTVKPNAGYTLPPFAATEQDGKLYGLGSNDAGGAVVCLLAVFLYYYEQQDLAYNMVWAATAEEEISGRNGIESVLDSLGPIAFAIVGEPTEMQMAIAEKGLMVVDCTVQGKAGHAARNEGDNAIIKAMDDIRWFSTYRFPRTSETLGDIHMNVTMINGGIQHNVVPDLCNFTVDIRTTDAYSYEELLEIIRSNVSCTVTPRSLRLKPSAISKEHPLVAAANETGIATFSSATMSDQALMPFPSVKIGPGSSSRSHAADEYIYTSELKEGIAIYLRLISQIQL